MTEPALGLCFLVEIDDGRSLGAWTKCEGLSVEWDIHEYKEGGVNDFVHRLPGRAKYQNLKLTRPVTTATGRSAGLIPLARFRQKGLEYARSRLWRA